MKIISTSVENEQNKSLMTVQLSMGALDQYVVENIDGFSDRLSKLLPNFKIERYAVPNGPAQGTSIARLFAHITIDLQAQSGFLTSYWKVSNASSPGAYDITFECSCETSGDYVARAAFRILRAALYRQRYNISPDLNLLSSLKNASKSAA